MGIAARGHYYFFCPRAAFPTAARGKAQWWHSYWEIEASIVKWPIFHNKWDLNKNSHIQMKKQASTQNFGAET